MKLKKLFLCMLSLVLVASMSGCSWFTRDEENDETKVPTENIDELTDLESAGEISIEELQAQ